jgi:predicted HAD superfamily Cof-like phosphohydrolase
MKTISSLDALERCGQILPTFANLRDTLRPLVDVTYGAALHYGIDLDAAIAEVHRANMSKVGRRGGAMIGAPLD